MMNTQNRFVRYAVTLLLALGATASSPLAGMAFAETAPLGGPGRICAELLPTEAEPLASGSAIVDDPEFITQGEFQSRGAFRLTEGSGALCRDDLEGLCVVVHDVYSTDIAEVWVRLGDDGIYEIEIRAPDGTVLLMAQFHDCS
jgi:hypothetical protein